MAIIGTNSISIILSLSTEIDIRVTLNTPKNDDIISRIQTKTLIPSLEVNGVTYTVIEVRYILASDEKEEGPALTYILIGVGAGIIVLVVCSVVVVKLARIKSNQKNSNNTNYVNRTNSSSTSNNLTITIKTEGSGVRISDGSTDQFDSSFSNNNSG